MMNLEEARAKYIAAREAYLSSNKEDVFQRTKLLIASDKANQELQDLLDAQAGLTTTR